MKKIDLHIHTYPTASDAPFTFSMETLCKYVTDFKLDAIAVTNHNIFEKDQFDSIRSTLEIPVFPGIEVDVENGHLLVISNPSDLSDFQQKCSQVHRIIGDSPTRTLSENEFQTIFTDLSKYIFIPHYDKKPSLDLSRVPNIKSFISCGEVASEKKFISQKKAADELVPVLFSDLRMKDTEHSFCDRQTFFDIGEITFTSIKHALLDKAKVDVSEENSHKLIDIDDSGLKISTGLTVILGKRSSGKSYTLDKINNEFPDAKYIKQFSLLSKDCENDKRRFEEILKNQGSSIADLFLLFFKSVVDDVVKIDIEKNDQDIDEYLSTLKKAALEVERNDVYAKAILFQENPFVERNLDSLENLIKAVDLLLQNEEYRELIDSHISRQNLIGLFTELILQYEKEKKEILRKKYVNDIIESVKKDLQIKSSSTPIYDVDFLNFLLDKVKVEKFQKVVDLLKQPRIISQKNLYSFRVVAKSKPYSGAFDLQRKSKSKTVFSDAFNVYVNAYSYLSELKKKTELPSSDYYKYFVDISYEVLNQYGTAASGGERSEYNLLQELLDANRKSILLLDEPESSFDNLFLKDGVDALLKDISKKTPVVIVTHNNTIGASVHPDYLIYTQKDVLENGTVKYRVFSGYPTDSELIDLEGEKLSRKEVLLNCLEAGELAYNERKKSYEILNY